MGSIQPDTMPGMNGPSNRPSFSDEEDTKAGRFVLIERIAAGGMGTVWKAWDPDLGRDLAVKILLPQFRANPDWATRFQEEARIASHLQHPGIVPIHELGQMPDGRPFFAMRLVRGKTLAEILRQRSDPSEDWPRLLSIFESLCQAVAFAHSRGVLHRDLKPANVMVGEFGEIQVMDWGIAKILNSAISPVPNVSAAPPPVSPPGSGKQTLVGSVLGTFGYMAPEQADGSPEIDERADVFALGAILCEILTGFQPFGATDPISWNIRDVHHELATTIERVRHCGADPELIDVAVRCLALTPTDRPADAGAVAESVGRYRNAVQERLRQATLERERAQVRAQAERRARWLTLIAGGLLAILLIGAGFGGVYWVRQIEQTKKRAALQEARIEEMLKQVLIALRANDLEQARTILERSSNGGWSLEISENLRERLHAAQTHLELASDLEEIRLAGANWIGPSGFDHESVMVGYAQVFTQVGLDVTSEQAFHDHWKTKLDRSPIRDQIIDALDSWARVAHLLNRFEVRDRVLNLARQIDPDPAFRDRFRTPAVWDDRDAMRNLIASIPEGKIPPRLLGNIAWLIGEDERLLREAQLHAPHDFWTNFDLGIALGETQTTEAIGFLRAALAVRPENTAALTNLGTLFDDQGNPNRAEPLFRRVLDLDPNHLIARTNLGIALTKQNRGSEAIAHLQTVRQHFATLPPSPAVHQQIGRVDYLIGQAWQQAKQRDRAWDAYGSAIENHPADALSWVQRGILLVDQGDPDTAEEYFLMGVCLDPLLTQAWFNLNIARQMRGDWSEAISAIQQYLRLEPGDRKGLETLAKLYWRAGQLPQAVTAHRDFLRVHPDHAPGWYNLAIVYKNLGRVNDAETSLREAIRLEPNFAPAHAVLGELLGKDPTQGRNTEEAERSFQRAISLAPNDPRFHDWFGSMLRAHDRFEEAIRAHTTAVQLDPHYAEGFCHLGLTYVQLGRFEDAVRMLEKGNELARRRPDWSSPSKEWLDQARMMAERNRRLNRVLRGEEKLDHPMEAVTLALFCANQVHRDKEAVGLFQEMFTRWPELSQFRPVALRVKAAESACRAELYDDALRWLRSELEDWQTRLRDAPLRQASIAETTLRGWLDSPSFARVRESSQLAALEPDMRNQWNEFWKDVRSMLGE